MNIESFEHSIKFIDFLVVKHFLFPSKLHGNTHLKIIYWKEH